VRGGGRGGEEGQSENHLEADEAQHQTHRLLQVLHIDIKYLCHNTYYIMLYYILKLRRSQFYNALFAKCARDEVKRTAPGTARGRDRERERERRREGWRGRERDWGRGREIEGKGS
jgi:hypothetical protein